MTALTSLLQLPWRSCRHTGPTHRRGRHTDTPGPTRWGRHTAPDTYGPIHGAAEGPRRWDWPADAVCKAFAPNVNNAKTSPPPFVLPYRGRMPSDPGARSPGPIELSLCNRGEER